MPKIRFVSDVESTQKYVQQILKYHPIVGLCCKLGHQGQVALIAVSTDEGTVYVFDVKEGRAVLFDGGLHRILQASDVLKVMHDCGESVSALHRQHAIHLRHIFDAQVAYSVVLQSEDLPPRIVSLPVLCDKIGIAQHQPGIQLTKLLHDDRDIWMRRPMSTGLLNVIASDVTPLFPTLYRKLVRAIHPSLIPWFEAMNREQVQSGYHPIKVKERRHTRVRLEEKETAKHIPSTSLTNRQTRLLSDTIPIQRK